MNLNQIDIQNELVRHISFEALTTTEDNDVATIACESIPVTYWNEYCGMNNTFTIRADNEDELEEKTSDLIRAFEMYSHCQKIKPNGTREGFDMSIFLQTSNVANNALHNNYIILDSDEHEIEDLDEPVAFFFLTEDELMKDYDKESEEYTENLNWLTSEEDSDYPVNNFSEKLNLNGKCYHDVYQIPASLISEYVDL